NQRFGQTLGGWVELLAGGAGLAGAILGTQPNVPLILGTDNQERVRIQGNGNVAFRKNVSIDGNLIVLGGWGAWSDLTPNSPFWGHADDPDGTTMTLQYRKVGDVVQLRGE